MNPASEAHRIEPINGSTFRIPYNQWAEVEIGDAARDIFRPHAKIKRWGDECWLKVELPTVETKAPLVEDGKVAWVAEDREVHFYPLAPADGMEEGGFEFEVILKQKPETNKIVLEIETQGLDFFYQPPLTQEELDSGDIRPENVVGSYAVYHATKGNMHPNKAEADKYKVGKAFHIYRPRVVDSAGRETWATLGLDKRKGALTITIDQGWLDAAVYPISVDPTFGNTGIGASSVSIENVIGCVGDTPADAGTADSISAYIFSFTSTATIKAALYVASDESLLSPQTEEITVTAFAWNTLDFSGGPSISAVKHYIGCWGGTAAVTLRADTGSSGHRFRSITYDGWPDPLAGTTSATIRTIYCTYTVGGAPATRRYSLTTLGVG